MKTLKLSRTKRGIDCRLYLRRPLAVESSAGRIPGILGENLVDLLSTKKPPHVDLANLPDDEAAAAKFVASAGDCCTRTRNTPSRLAKRGNCSTFPRMKRPGKLAAAYPKAPNFFSHTRELVIGDRDTLRKAWKGDRLAIETMTQHVAANMNSTWSFNSGRIEIGVPDLWTAVCVLFLNDRGRGKAGICERGSECPARYFLKPRTDQRFCGGDCKRWARLEVKRRWFRINRGKQQ